MSTIYSNSNDGSITKIAIGGTFSDIRTAETGSSIVSTAVSSTTAIRAYKTIHATPRFGCSRSFFEFDTSSITKQLYSLKLMVKGTTNGTSDVIAVQAKHSDTLNINDYSQIVTTIPYSNKITSWSILGYNIIELNVRAIKNALKFDTLKLALINYTYDYKGGAPAAGITKISGLYFQEERRDISDPKLEYVERLKYYKGKRVGYNRAVIIASNKSGDTFNFVKDKNGKQLVQDDVVKFRAGYFNNMVGDWKIFPSTSQDRTDGDGEITLVNDTNGWNFSFDFGRLPDFQNSSVSCSFLEHVS